MVAKLPLAESYSAIATGVELTVWPSGVSAVTADAVFRFALRWVRCCTWLARKPSPVATQLGSLGLHCPAFRKFMPVAIATTRRPVLLFVRVAPSSDGAVVLSGIVQ